MNASAIARALALLALGWSSGACRVAAADGAPSPAGVAAPSARSVVAADAPAASTLPIARPAALALPATVLADIAGPPSDARRESCGSMSRLLSPGSGELSSSDDDRVLLEYSTFSRSGQPLDSSATHGQPVAESVRSLPAGLPCVVKRMRVGESRRVWLPAALQPAGQEDPRSVQAIDLTIDVTLRELSRAPERPIDYASPPAIAKHTASGLRLRFLRRGSGERHPAGNSRVTIAHSGWTSRGVLFESSAFSAQPASYLTYELPAGLSEGVKLMRVGDKARFWLPERLAFAAAHRSAVKGSVVFDVELLAID
jgi:FKBP-type peptidyl-prolyl cis-trans isomerase